MARLGGGEGLRGDVIEELESLCESNLLTELVEQYISGCYGQGADGVGASPPISTRASTRASTRLTQKAQEGVRFPNLAGFCRYLGIGLGDFSVIMEKYPTECDAVLAALEDEALNMGNSATLISAYMKQRLGYGKLTPEPKYHCDSERLELVFEHDIFEDGE